jgi:trimeric autotransporter adhesin
MKSTNIRVAMLGVFLFFAPVGWAQQPVSAEPQAPSATVQAPREVVPPLPVPRLVKFAGAFKDEQGKARTGVAGVTFAVYKEPEGGAALWLETQNVQLDEQGRYTVLLGSTKSEGLPLELFTTGEPRWLGAQVQLPGEVEQPRVLLVSVPYALKAADADTLGGKPLSSFVTTEQAAGSSGSAIGKPTTSQSIAPLVTTTNVVPKWVDNMGTLGNSQITDDGTNVNMTGNAGALAYKFTGNAAPPTDPTATIFNQAGVGPTFSGFSFSVRTGTTPANALTVDPSHNVSMTGNASALAYRFTGNAAPPTDPTATIFNQAFVGPVFSGLSFRVRTGAPMPQDALTVDPNQRVGIGTTAPSQRLEVGGNIKLSGGGAVIFPDGSVMSRAATGVGGGTITSVTAGAGLTGGGTAGGVTLGINPNVAVTTVIAQSPSGVPAVTASSTGNAVGVHAISSVFPAVLGESFGTPAAGGAHGVVGFTHNRPDYGVVGSNFGGGIGISGSGGTGVFGTGTNFGFATDSNVQQDRAAGGWVKAMVFYSGFNSGRIVTCFNSTLAGAAATTPPCGFGFHNVSTGDDIIDFGFQVDDRFFAGFAFPCTDFNGFSCANSSSLTPNQVEFNPGVATKFYFIVF